MKLLLLVFAVTLVAAEELVPSDKAVGYHEKFGVPQAEKIKIKEAVESRIVGGMISYNGQNPFLAGLLIDLTNGLTSVCAGTLLNDRKVLTAGQCWYDGYWQGKSITVVLGSTKLFSGGMRQRAYSIIVHPQFDPISIVNDLAMLSIPGVDLSSNIQPAMLPFPYPNSTFVGVSARVAGYGITSDKGKITSDQEQYSAYVTVIPNQQCDLAYNSPVTSSMICTSGSNEWGPCKGDAGAPLIYTTLTGENILIGVSSFHSVAGCQSGFPFGYMRATKFMNWIHSLLY